MAISNRLRYEVLRRDDYTCRYCGAKPPEVKITVDHVVPVALGGSDDPSNLAAACAACNGGKTSSSPDAPVVADVSEDALRWSRAINEAAERMRADHAGRQDIYDQFDDWWAGWNYGFRKTPLPRPADWRSSVDSFLAAGLPLDVLKWCVDKAGASKAPPDATWRYMCGVAWKKVTELQESAKAIAGSPGAAASGVAVASLMDGRVSLARELLADVSEEESAYFLECADVNEFLDEDEQRTKEEEACEAVSTLLNSARCNVEWIVSRIRKTLERLPPEIGKPCLAEMDEEASISDPISRMAWRGVNAMLALEDLIHLPDAATYMTGLPEEEQREWLRYADALCGNPDLSPERLLVHGMNCAKAVKAGEHWEVMCLGPGDQIPRCSSRATRRLRFDGPECCRDGGEDHDHHKFCERHSELAIAGDLNRGGKPAVVLSWAPLAAASSEAPF